MIDLLFLIVGPIMMGVGAAACVSLMRRRRRRKQDSGELTDCLVVPVSKPMKDPRQDLGRHIRTRSIGY